MKNAPNMPFLIRVEDYHRFDQIQEAMRLINPKARVSEVDIFDGDGEFEFPYVGVVYEGRKPSKKTLLDICRDPKTRVHDLRP
jgi:hypothetical protein